MKKIITIIVSLVPFQALIACTILSVSGDNGTFAASNKDWNNTAIQLKVFAPSNGNYGRLYFGYQVPEGFQNVEGVNDQGLWYSGASLPERNDIYNHYQKPTVAGELCEKALAECATVDEVIELYSSYFTPHWQGHSMWVDRNGHSIIVEYGERDVVFIFPEQHYQVMTNFYLSDSLNRRWYNCYRFDVTNEQLKDTRNPSNHSIQHILDNVHQEGLFPTVSSNIYNLNTGELILYYFHQYNEYLTLNVYEQIAQGDQTISLPDRINHIEIMSPKNGKDIAAPSVCLEWRGNAVVYDIYYSPANTFPDCTPIHYIKPNLASIKCDLPIILIFVFLVLKQFRKMNKSIKVKLVCITVIFMAKCDLGIINSPIEESGIYHKLTIDNLENGTLYFWKIVTPDNSGIRNSSCINYFFTKQH